MIDLALAFSPFFSSSLLLSTSFSELILSRNKERSIKLMQVVVADTRAVIPVEDENGTKELVDYSYGVSTLYNVVQIVQNSRESRLRSNHGQGVLVTRPL